VPEIPAIGWLDKNGKPSVDREETHIPFDQFIFRPEIFK